MRTAFRLAAEKNRENQRTVEAAETRRRPGRPGRLTAELADAIVAQLAAASGSPRPCAPSGSVRGR
jgi:hypothetical protein